MSQSARTRRLAMFGTGLAVSLGALFIALPYLSGFLARLVPHAVESTVGRQMIARLDQEDDFCRDASGMAALRELTQRLAAQTGGAYEFRVYIADEHILNAFAAPGGHIVLYRSVIDEAETPEEVAGVLAHEMAHITAAHPARAMVESLGYGVFRLLTPGDDNIGQELVSGAVSSHYSREDELEADAAGVDFLNGAGIDSHGLYAFFDRISSDGTDAPGAPEFMSTHPSGTQRKQALEDRVQLGEPALDDGQWRALKNICQETGEIVYVEG